MPETSESSPLRAQDHADLSAILDTGLAIIVEIDDRDSHPVLSIALPLADATD